MLPLAFLCILLSLPPFGGRLPSIGNDTALTVYAAFWCKEYLDSSVLLKVWIVEEILNCALCLNFLKNFVKYA